MSITSPHLESAESLFIQFRWFVLHDLSSWLGSPRGLRHVAAERRGEEAKVD